MDTVTTLLPDPGILTFLLALLAVVITFHGRNRLQVGPFAVSDEAAAPAYKNLKTLILAEMRQILQVHQRLHAAAGELSLSRIVSLADSGQTIDFDADLAKHAAPKLLPLVDLLLTLTDFLFRPPRLRGEVVVTGSRLRIVTSLHVRGRPVRQLRTVELDSLTPEHVGTAAREIALALILERSNQQEIRSTAAFDLLTQALASLPSLTINSSGKDAFAMPQKLLEAAAALENSPFVSYNLGLIHYYRYGAEGNEKAIELFERSTRTNHERLGYLSRIALARCLCQEYHRLGRQRDQDLDETRAIAADALERVQAAKARARRQDRERLRHDEAYALSVMAFAHHVTEEREDIDRAIPLYEHAIALLADETPAVFYNNLGYILMARGGRFTPLPGEEARYERAVEAFEEALARESSYKFALANLGNVERLRGNHERAIQRYEEALEWDPGYANGHAELAWVHLSAGDEAGALHHHREALRLADDDAHRGEIMEHNAYVLHGLGRVEEALRLAREAWCLNERNGDLRRWLDRHDRVGV